MAFILIEGLLYAAEAVGVAIEAETAAVAASGAVDGLANVAWGTMAGGASAVVAGGAVVATIGNTMGQTTGTPTTIGSGEIPQTPAIVNDGSRNVVYDPGALPTPARVVYQPYVNSLGVGSDPRGGEMATGVVYNGVRFGRRKGRRRRFV